MIKDYKTILKFDKCVFFFPILNWLFTVNMTHMISLRRNVYIS